MLKVVGSSCWVDHIGDLSKTIEDLQKDGFDVVRVESDPRPNLGVVSYIIYEKESR